MAGRQVDSPVVVKLVGVFPGNVALGLEPHPAVIALFDATTGACLALMDGEHITGLRTAAAAALSTRALAREDASVLAIVGSGVQARAHLRMLPLVRSFSSVRRGGARSRRRGAAGRRARGTIEGADVICLTTSASSAGRCRSTRSRPGTHVTSVGFAPPGGELDPALARAGRLFVETRQAFEPPPAGCAELAGSIPRRGPSSARCWPVARRAARPPPRSRSTRRWATSPRTPRRPSSSTARRSTRAREPHVDL